MRLCLLSLPGPVPGLPGSWGQIGALLFFQGVKKHYPPSSSLSLLSLYPAGPTQRTHPSEARRGGMDLEPRTARLCPSSATL